MNRAHRLLLLVIVAVIVLGFSTSEENSACGQQMGAMGTRNRDWATSFCVDGNGSCTGFTP